MCWDKSKIKFMGDNGISGPLTLRPNKQSCEVSTKELGMISVVNIGKVHTIIDPKVMNDFDRANRKLKAFAKSLLIAKGAIISAQEIIWCTLRG